MVELVSNVPPSLAAVESRLDTDFPKNMWERISNGMRAQADAFRKQAFDAGLVSAR
jgi:hypothetical protein